MLAVVLSIASLSVVYATEEYEGQEAVSGLVSASELGDMITPEPTVVGVDDEEGLIEPEVTVTPEPTVTPEEMEFPEETPDEAAEPEETTIPELTIDLSRNARDAAVEGWSGSGNKFQYFKKNSSGVIEPLTGWQDIAGRTFYFDPKNSNYAATGFKSISGKIYYFLEKGGAGVCGGQWRGWRTINGKIFYFSKASGANRGAMFTGWKKVGKKIYYFSKAKGLGNKGAVLTGWRKVGGKTFYFSTAKGQGNKGAVLTGWQRLSYKDRKTGKTKKAYFYLSKAKGLGKKGRMVTGWAKIGGAWYYMNNDKGDSSVSIGVMQSNRWMKISGQWYRFSASGAALTGWQYIDGLKYYFNPMSSKQACALDQDIRDMVSGPYRATINRKTCTVTMYVKDPSSGRWIVPVKAFACSVGLPATPTPTGTFYTPAKYRVHELMGPSWGQYCTRIVGGVLFHSVAGTRNIPYNISAGAYNLLGSPASHGCVRLSVRDAKWIYDNCALGMQVTIGDNIAQPFDRPPTIKIPASQNWDPTDPAV